MTQNGGANLVFFSLQAVKVNPGSFVIGNAEVGGMLELCNSFKTQYQQIQQKPGLWFNRLPLMCIELLISPLFLLTQSVELLMREARHLVVKRLEVEHLEGEHLEEERRPFCVLERHLCRVSILKVE